MIYWDLYILEKLDLAKKNERLEKEKLEKGVYKEKSSNYYYYIYF